ncbi:MAG: hypothetical protein P8Y64_10720 [Gammaproteobacteria bacterium]|jgi:hypothetical protein
MKSIKVTNLGEIRNELNKYKRGRKLDIHQFNQIARLAWLGKVALQPLDPEDPECKSLLVYVDYPDELAGHYLNTDQELLGHMIIVDGQQGEALIEILRSGVQERASLYEELSRSDFYFRHFYKSEDDSGNADGE